MRQERQCRAEAVVHRLVDIAAAGREKAMQLRPRLMENSGGRPALRAAHDRRIAMYTAHALDLASDQIERLVPRHRHERFAAAAGTGAALQVALPHHRLCNPRRRIHRGRNGGDQVGRIGIVLERANAHHTALLHLRKERAPMRVIADELHRHALMLALDPGSDWRAM